MQPIAFDCEPNCLFTNCDSNINKKSLLYGRSLTLKSSFCSPFVREIMSKKLCKIYITCTNYWLSIVHYCILTEIVNYFSANVCVNIINVSKCTVHFLIRYFLLRWVVPLVVLGVYICMKCFVCLILVKYYSLWDGVNVSCNKLSCILKKVHSWPHCLVVSNCLS